ncbi:hypothetical protein SLEP1_g56505 [Rubroshorea leprosula]|uniref:Uncharacterized protein n=1 Tax=Rubroshorea leprosula TaxID=152421 RepID=A0AAV5MLN3_9ROSI|nr:hypothetical protein SLEP1_g56505 [Rubroshorea leprosula]
MLVGAHDQYRIPCAIWHFVHKEKSECSLAYGHSDYREFYQLEALA